MIFLGIDLGTSGVKAIAIDAAQHTLASHTAPLHVTHPQNGWSEQNPSDWIKATCLAMESLKAKLGLAMGDVKGIGLSGQMHGATFLDRAGKVLRPAILWNDSRSHSEAARLDADPRFQAISGNIVFPGFTAPKLVWAKAHEPDVFRKTAKVLLPKDYLRFWLTGEYVSDMSDASGTAWLDTGRRAWSDTLLGACSLTQDHMPALVEGTDPSGAVRPELAARWGVPAGTVVAGGAGDNAASAIGLGTIHDGDGFVSLGTSGVLFAATGAYRPSPKTAIHSFCHALPDRWHQMGVILAAGSSLEWLASICGADAATLVNDLGAHLRAPGPITFLPYLSGERTPHNDPHLRGSFIGLSQSSTRIDLTQAVVEGVAFALLENRNALKDAGSEIERLTAVGGGARSTYWLKLIATILQTPITRPRGGDFGAAFGAARLGMIASGHLGVDAACTLPVDTETFEPDQKLTAAFAEKFLQFKADRIASQNR